MNWYFYRVWLPLQILLGIGIAMTFFNTVLINWWIVVTCFFLMGPVGIGVGFHRLFSHRSFTTWRPVEILLAFFGTLSAYAPILFWCSNHHYHHRHSDYEEDTSSPAFHGFWASFLTYRMKKGVLKKINVRNTPIKKMLRDPVLMFISTRFELIIWTYVIILFVIGGWGLLLSGFLIPSALEHLRTNIVSSLCHLDLPLSYRNHCTDDMSQNNILLGYLTFGFAWHNNHHKCETKVSYHEKWWEIDIEGLIAKALSK